MKSSPEISVIMPTHNRRSSVVRTLYSLANQTVDANRFEILVVADGCTDDTVSFLSSIGKARNLRVFEQPGNGAGCARNYGASQARARLLLFLDDDIQASPRLIEAHVSSHRDHRRRVSIGYLPPALEGEPDFFKIGLRYWWEEQFLEMSRRGHRFTYRDLLSGNFSLSADLFREVGGFDETLKCREDYELGFRLITAKAELQFCRDAMGYHFDNSTLARSFKRAFAEGRGDVVIGRRHRELRSSLLLAQIDSFNSRRDRIAHDLAFRNPRLGDMIARLWYKKLAFLERIRRRGKWRDLFKTLRFYWYWRGVASELKTRAALADFLQRAPLVPKAAELEIDLSLGLESAERALDAERPGAAFIRHREVPVGAILPVAGAEPLRGAHLRPFLATGTSKSMLFAVAMDSVAQSNDLKTNQFSQEFAYAG